MTGGVSPPNAPAACSTLGKLTSYLYTGNCEPRKKAVLREVKKDNPNKGRFFWSCNVYPFCKFFLWRDDAVVRETGAPSATDAAGTAQQLSPPKPKTPSFTQRPLTSFGVRVRSGRRGSEPDTGTLGRGISTASSDDEDEKPSSASSQARTIGAASTATTASIATVEQEAEASMATPRPPPSKRKRDELDDDEFSDLGSDDEQQLAEIADKSAEKAMRHANALATPAADRTTDAGTNLQTPSVARTLFPSTDAKRLKTVSFEEPYHVGPPTPARTPATGGRAADLLDTPSSSPHDAAPDVTDQVMALLRGQRLESSVLGAVHALLDTAARKTRGLAMGRESTRAALKLKDDKIARLQERVAALENKEKFHSSQMTNIKAQLMQMYEDN